MSQPKEDEANDANLNIEVNNEILHPKKGDTKM